jgi:head-tail adaptor
MKLEDGVGTFRERITVERPGWPELSVTITRSGSVATITGWADWQDGDYVLIAGAAQGAYNGTKQVTVSGSPEDATFPVDASTDTPATGTITAQFVTDAQGGVRPSWTTVAADLPAAMAPLSAMESLRQMPQALMTTRTTRFKVRVVAGLSEVMRVRWTPVWPAESAEQTLQIQGVIPEGDGRRFLFLECVGP